MGARLVELGYMLCTGGTDNHLILVDLKGKNVSGQKMSLTCDKVGITLNKNTVIGDKSALSPGGVRIGSSALTSRGFLEADFVKVADMIDRVCTIIVSLQAGPDGKKLTEKKYAAALANPPADVAASLAAIAADVQALACSFFMPGSDITPETVAAFRASLQ